jgi:pyruvate dehydrogenase E2 component (dihydrolipoyllysine-residue acetyltransferase)
MPIPVTIPRLGWNMDEGTFVEWVKADGDAVRAGEVLFRLEGEKATEEVECLDSGTLHIPAPGPQPGDKLVVGAVIGYLLQPGEVAPATIQRDPEVSASVAAPVRSEPENRKSSHPSAPGSQPLITPRARRLANRIGVDLSLIRGTGRSGRIRERDIAASSPSGEGVTPLTPIRRTIAARMIESHQSTAPVTLMSVVDATRLVALRDRFRTDGDPVPSYTDLIVKLAAAALEVHPPLASCWSEAGIVRAERIDIGIAVDTEAGLLVPVIRNVPSLGIPEIAARSRDLIDRARNGTLAAGEMRGGCFTVTNLGAFGVDAFTPIINFPECAVLGIGRIARQAVIDGDRVVGRERVTLSLTFDHRIVDGGPAARFLQTLAQLIENPERSVGFEVLR